MEDFIVTNEEFEKGRDLAIGMIGNGVVKYLGPELKKEGEILLKSVQLNLMIFNAGFFVRKTLFTLLKIIGMGRTVKQLKNFHPMSNS